MLLLLSLLLLLLLVLVAVAAVVAAAAVAAVVAGFFSLQHGNNFNQHSLLLVNQPRDQLLHHQLPHTHQSCRHGF